MCADSATYQDKIYPSWEDVQDDTAQLAAELAKLGPWKGIVAVTRGGMVPATIVSRLLNIKLIETFCVSSYDYQDQSGLQILRKPDIGDGEGWLFVDDLVDTGKTYAKAREVFPEGYLSCVYAKPMGKPMTDLSVKDVEQKTWVAFPWEFDEN